MQYTFTRGYMLKYRGKSWQDWLNQYFWKKLLAVLALVLLVFATVSEVNVEASYFDRNHQSDYFGESSLVTSPTSQNNSGQISNEVRQRLTSEPKLPNQSTSVIEPLGSDACVEWYQIISGNCIMRLVVNVWGYIIMIIFALIGALIDAGVFYSFQLIEFLLSGNPTAQGSDAWFIAQQIYPILLNIALLLILFSFYYVGFQYLFGIKSGRVGWQEFLAKVVLAVILVNFSVFLVSIFVSFLHDIGSLFVNIYAQGGGSVGGAFQVAMKKAAGYNIDANDFFGTMGTLPNIFTPIGDFWMLVLVRIIYVAVGIFILMSLFRLVKIVLTRYVLLFLLLVIAPLGVVLFFSPIKALKEKGDQWLQTLWTQTILYPFFVITMAIGTVFIVNFANTAVPVDELRYLDQTKLSSQFPRILALLVAFGVIQVIVNFFEKSFEGIASSTWTALKMGAVGGAATFLGSFATTLSTAKNLVKGAQIGAQFGRQKFGRAGALGFGLAGGLIGAGIGVKKGFDKTANIAAGAATAVDLLGGEKVADKLANAPGILGKTFRAAQAQNKAFFANFAGLLAKKANFAITEKLRKSGFGDDALQLRRDIDIAIDMILPPNDYTGDSRGDLPRLRTGEGYKRAETAGKLAKYKTYGYDPKLSSSQVLQRLKDIVTGNTAEELREDYAKYPESVKEIAEEIIKRPEIISKLTPQQIEFFRANYERLIRDIPGWEEFVTSGGGVLLANEEKRKLVAKDDAQEGIEAVKQGKVSRRNFNDPVYLNEYLTYLRENNKVRDLEELGKILDRDFSAFKNLNTSNLPQSVQDYGKKLKNIGLSFSSIVKKQIFSELLQIPNIASLELEEQAEETKAIAERVLKNEFFQVSRISSAFASANNAQDRAQTLERLVKQNPAFGDFLENWKRNNPKADLVNNTNNELQQMLSDYSALADSLTNAYIDSDKPTQIAAEFRDTNAQYKAMEEDLKKGGSRGAPAGLVGPNGQPIRRYVASRKRNSSSGSGTTGTGNNSGGSTGNSPSSQPNQGPQGPAPASGSSSTNASPAPTPAAQATTGGSGGGAPAPAPAPTPTPTPTTPQAAPAPASQPNVQVNIVNNLQDLQKTSQQVTSFISGRANSDLNKAMENINRLIQNTIQKIQSSSIPSGVDPAELEKKIKAIIEAQNRIGEGVNKVYKPGAKVDVNHPEIDPYIQNIAQTLIDIGNIYNSLSNINNQNQGGSS